jgi:hypothetical protein
MAASWLLWARLRAKERYGCILYLCILCVLSWTSVRFCDGTYRPHTLLAGTLHLIGVVQPQSVTTLQAPRCEIHRPLWCPRYREGPSVARSLARSRSTLAVYVPYLLRKRAEAASALLEGKARTLRAGDMRGRSLLSNAGCITCAIYIVPQACCRNA